MTEPFPTDKPIKFYIDHIELLNGIINQRGLNLINQQKEIQELKRNQALNELSNLGQELEDGYETIGILEGRIELMKEEIEILQRKLEQYEKKTGC